MGAKKILSTRDRNPLNVQSPETTLSLGAGQYTLWQSGIEFHSPKPLALWGEMVVEVTTVADQKKSTPTASSSNAGATATVVTP